MPPPAPADLNRLFDALFPICRSIAGEGLRQSLALLQQHIPLDIHALKSGSKVYDWQVPQEWRLIRATLTDPYGEVVVDSEDSNLHVVNFSEPFRGKVSLPDLQQHLYSIPELPNAIPYVTSYYKKRWGLCLSHAVRSSLKEGEYRVDIDTEKKDGALNYGSCDLRGNSDEVFLLSSYLCHPSMANNELSGPLCLVRLYEKLRAWNKRHYTYKFVIVPETIGTLVFLSEAERKKEPLFEKMAAGLVVTCVGGRKKPISVKRSRRDWLEDPSDLDLLVQQLARTDPRTYVTRDFTPTSGSDERQYCSPGRNLPVLQVAKTVYGEYAEYHTSLDTKEFMDIDAVEESAEQIFQLLQVFEMRDRRVQGCIPCGEPHLGKRDLYPTFNSRWAKGLSSDRREDERAQLDLLLKILSLSDGSMTILDMACKLDESVLAVKAMVSELERHALLDLSAAQKA